MRVLTSWEATAPREVSSSPRTTRFGTEVSDAPYRLPPDPQVDPRLVKHLQTFFEPSLLRKVINRFTLK